VEERLVVDALANVAVPVTFALVNVAPVPERLVVEALRMVAVPVVFELVTVNPVAERAVVEAFVIVPLVIIPFRKVRPVPEMPVVEALTRVVKPVTPRVPPIVVFPPAVTAKRDEVVPIEKTF
jgi:hypothetical protein